jgi:glycerol-3-phosphate O-acyltransferase
MTFETTIEALCQAKKMPALLQKTFFGFCAAYRVACEHAGVDANSLVPVFTTFLDCVQKQLQTPFSFSPYHQAVRSPIDYYTMGLEFVRPLIDYEHSMLLGKNSLEAIDRSCQAGDNVILLSNHQTEIDPQIISLLIEKEHPKLAEKMIFVAGHRVTTDPLAVPLSLGRDLICIYSKRHIDSPPEKKAEKISHNQKAMKQLEELLTKGGNCIYIAPSGGRDRLNANGVAEVAPFDPQSIELFYLLAQKSLITTHFYTLALSTYQLLPPPDTILTDIGETRHTAFGPAHLVFGERIDMEHIGNCHKELDKKEKRVVRAAAIWQQVFDDYQAINSK